MRRWREAHPMYMTWNAMRHRCYNPKFHKFPWYGARGISVYGPWRNDYFAFETWIMDNLGPRPVGCTLDRIDNDGDYVPGNLRWATAREQRANQRPRRRRSITITFVQDELEVAA